MYLSAFEILKATIIEGVKNVVVFLPPPDEDTILALKKDMPANEFQAIFDSNVLSYRRLVEKYEKEVGVQFDKRDQFGLIPSCKWLNKEGILSKEEIENVKRVKEHRNQIAHELPSLLINRGLDVDLGYLEQIISILKKVEPFFARIDADIPAEVPDGAITSGGQIILGMVWDTVIEYLQELTEGN